MPWRRLKNNYKNILEQFQLADKVVSAEPFGNGHINDTLKVTNEKGEIKYVLQRINHLVFTTRGHAQTTFRLSPLTSARSWKKKEKATSTAKYSPSSRPKTTNPIISMATAIGAYRCSSRTAKATRR